MNGVRLFHWDDYGWLGITQGYYLRQGRLCFRRCLSVCLFVC